MPQYKVVDSRGNNVTVNASSALKAKRVVAGMFGRMSTIVSVTQVYAPPKRKPRAAPKPNDKCHCGSGKKYKTCCARPKKDPEHSRSFFLQPDGRSTGPAGPYGVTGPAAKTALAAQPGFKKFVEPKEKDDGK